MGRQQFRRGAERGVICARLNTRKRAPAPRQSETAARDGSRPEAAQKKAPESPFEG